MCDGREAWIDLTRISKATVYDMLRHMMIRRADYGDEIYIPTGDADKILKRPELALEMLQRVFDRKPFCVDSKGFIQDA